jgi:hypothetical protein
MRAMLVEFQIEATTLALAQANETPLDLDTYKAMAHYAALLNAAVEAITPITRRKVQ